MRLKSVAETLQQKRCRFTRDIARLIDHATLLGYEVALDQVKRPQAIAKIYAEQGIGLANSLHIDGLAADINLYKDGEYLTHTEEHQPLGEWWESLGPDYCWGGRFKDSRGRPKPDGNHYSITHGGRK